MNKLFIKTQITNILSKKIKKEEKIIKEQRMKWINQLKSNNIIEINSNKYVLEYILGKGSYGLVWKVTNNTNNYALKICFSNIISGELIHNLLNNSISIIKSYNIFLLNKSLEIPETYGFLMELGQPLCSSISYIDCFKILKDICNNIIELNNFNICHNDIKPDNIVLMNNEIGRAHV